MAAGALSSLLLAGCAGSPSLTAGEGVTNGNVSAQDSTSFSSANGTKSDAGRVSGPASGLADAAKPGAATPAVGVGPKLTKSSSLDLRVKDIGAAAARVRSIATGLQALVINEQIGGGGPDKPTPLPSNGEPSGDFNGFGTLTLSVPADKLDVALDQLSKIGTVLRRTTSSQDVTAQYVDTQSRLKTMTASVERVRALMAQAKDLGQVVALESELSRRQADLESLESQLAALKNSVDRSTLALSLSTPGNEPESDNGFLAGLRSGWDAFAASAAGLFTGIGAALPFAVFLALISAPAWQWWRRHRASRPAVVPGPVVPAATPAAAGPSA